MPRVRDGYIRLGTRGHARTLKTQPKGPVCRENVIASARPCPPVPPTNLHGKEGVDGSSPSEGFSKRPAYRGSLLSVPALASRWRTHFRHQLLARVPDNGLCRAPFRPRKLLDHMRVRRKHHGRGMASLLRDLDDA